MFFNFLKKSKQNTAVSKDFSKQNTQNSNDFLANKEENTSNKEFLNDENKEENLIKKDENSDSIKVLNSAYSFKKIALGLVFAMILGIICAFLASFYLEASFKVSSLIGIIALLVTLWTNKALPLGVVSLLPIILFPSFGIFDTKTATANYGNPIIFLFLGGFMLATATEKIGLHKIIAKKFLSFFPKTPK